MKKGKKSLGNPSGCVVSGGPGEQSSGSPGFSPPTEVGCVESHFLDSGSFTLWTKAATYAKENNTDKWAYYETDEFWKYLDQYAEFIRKYQYGIDYYANVDVIPNPHLSWRNQKYLEKKHGLNPIPVVHYTTDLKWLNFYIKKGYEIIALGGLVGSTEQDACRYWIDRCFEMVCNTPNRLPKVKIHGFGVTSYELLIRYPWWAVDSTSWTKVAAYGNILVPHKRSGKFVFTEQPYIIAVSIDSPHQKKRGAHFQTVSQLGKDIIKEWLNHIGIPLGKVGPNGEVLEYGVTTRHTERRAANLYFFEEMRKSLPEYPWPWKGRARRRFGLL